MQISAALIPTATSKPYLCAIARASGRLQMKNGDSTAFLHWRRLIVDVSIGAAILAVAFAATDTTADVLYRLLIPCALIGIALLLEPAPAAPGEDDSSRLSRVPIEPEPQAMGALDPAIVEAASV